MSRLQKPRYLVKVVDWSNQEAFIGTFTSHERARQLQDRINAGIDKRSDGVRGHAYVVEIEPNPGARAMVDWALGYPDEDTDEEQAEWERRANAEIGGVA